MHDIETRFHPVAHSKQNFTALWYFSTSVLSLKVHTSALCSAPVLESIVLRGERKGGSSFSAFKNCKVQSEKHKIKAQSEICTVLRGEVVGGSPLVH